MARFILRSASGLFGRQWIAIHLIRIRLTSDFNFLRYYFNFKSLVYRPVKLTILPLKF